MSALPNRSARARPRLYDATEIAQNYHDTFTKREWTFRDEFSWEWPTVWQHVGDSLGVCYESDKWKSKGDFVLYKHISESRHRCLCVPGFLRDYDSPDARMPTIGPLVSFAHVVMPKQFAILARFEEIDLRLHVSGSAESPRFGTGDEGHVAVTVAHAFVGCSQLRQGRKARPFLFIYTQQAGPLVLIVGKELDVEADGIVGN
jgi:hypothetical protein